MAVKSFKPYSAGRRFMTVASFEELTADKPGKKKDTKKQPLIYREVELTLEQELGTKVTVVPFKGKPGGTLCVEFYDPSELFKMTAKLTDLWNRTEEN